MWAWAAIGLAVLVGIWYLSKSGAFSGLGGGAGSSNASNPASGATGLGGLGIGAYPPMPSLGQGYGSRTPKPIVEGSPVGTGYKFGQGGQTGTGAFRTLPVNLGGPDRGGSNWGVS